MMLEVLFRTGSTSAENCGEAVKASPVALLYQPLKRTFPFPLSVYVCTRRWYFPSLLSTYPRSFNASFVPAGVGLPPGLTGSEVYNNV